MSNHISDVLNDLQRHFENQLAQQLEDIHTLYQKLDLSNWQVTEAEQLHQLLHRITGSAGTFGMPLLSTASRNIETRLATLIHTGSPPDEAEWLTIGNAIQQLDQRVLHQLTPARDTLRGNLAPALQPLIYLVEDEPAQAGLLRQELQDNGYRIKLFNGLDEFRVSCASTDPVTEQPAALVIDMMSPENDTTGLRLLAEIKNTRPVSMPVIFVSLIDDLPMRLAAFRAGTTRYMVKPLSPGQLTAQLDALTDRQPLSPYRVLLLDDEPLLLETYATFLRAAGMEVQTLSQPLEILRAVDRFKPDVVVLDVYMPEANGPELAAILREREAQMHLPILFLSSETDISQQLLALSLGGDDFLVKPVQAEHLVAAVSARAQRVRQNQALHHSLQTSQYENARQHLALDQHAMVSITDEAGAITYVNDKFCEVSQYSPEELLGQNHRILKSGLQPVEFYRTLWTTITQGEIWQGKICNRCKDGSLYWVNSTITPFLDETGRPYQYVSLLTDITQVELTETALMEKEARLNFLVSSSPVCIYTCKATPPYGATYISPNVTELMGYNPSQFTDDANFWTSNIHPDDRQQVFDKLPQLFEHDSHQHEYRYRMPDGSYRWMIDEIRLIRNSSGEPTEIIGYWADLTDRKQTEIALQQSESRFRETLDQAPALIWIADIDNKGIWYNHRWLEYTGRSMEQELGFGWLEGMHPDDRERAGAFCQSAFDKHEKFEMEFRLRRADGSYGWIVDAGIPSFAANGDFEGYIGYCWDITDRKLAEQALETHKERLRRGQIFANLGTWDWDIQNGHLFWSERIAPLFGYPKGDLETSYNNFITAVHPDDRQAVNDAVSACVADDTPYNIEHRVVWPDGTVRWLLERGAVVRDDKGNPLHMLGVVQDIDDRKRAELALSERERQLREAQTLARIGNWMADLTNGELFWSDEIYRIFGHEPGSFAPSVEAFHAAVHPDDRELVTESEKQAEKTGRHDVVHRILRPDGSVRYVHELAQAENDATGKLLRLTGTVQDITERVEAEARLHETEERFAFAVEGAGDGVWDWNMTTGSMQFSRIYMEMLGYTENELPHTVDTWINSVHPDDIVPVQQNLNEFLEGKIQVYAVELRLRCKDGNYKWILCRGTIVKRDNKGNPVRMIGIHSDITANKLAEQALIDARDEADRANKAKSEFLSNMSHELRTPMNAILGFGQVMEYDDQLSSEQKENVQEILKGGRHLLELINEVLDLAKVESGNIELSLEPVELCPLVTECFNMMQTMADKHGIQLHHTCQQEIAVRADHTRLKQVLINLISNAIKYNREGGSVKLKAEIIENDRLRITVTDSGMGIARERLKELFQPFNRLDAENSGIEGTGIGLTITRRIVEMMGGVVDVKSEPGVGSNFFLELPLETLPRYISEEHNAGNGNTISSTQQPVNQPQHIVLYIEDNPSNLKLVSQIMGRRKHVHLLTAHTPELGIELAQNKRPNLILLDINMPGMDGYQVLEIFKADERLKTTPVVAVTANAMPRDIERGKAAGFTDYLTKPLDIVRFQEVVDTCLDGQGQQGIK